MYSLNSEEVRLLNFGVKDGNGMASLFLWVSFSFQKVSIYYVTKPFLRGWYLGSISAFLEWIPTLLFRGAIP